MKKKARRKALKKGLRIGAICAAAVLVLLVAAALVVWNVNEFSLTMTVAGEEEITLEHGEVYTAPEASAVFSGTVLMKEPTAVDVTITGKVDTAKPGTYELTYSSEYLLDYFFGEQTFRQTQVRKVHVVDTKAPEITLVTDPATFTLPGHDYVEEGYRAVDNCDGDITPKVIREVVDDTVVYTVSDSSGNQTQVVRQIVYGDPYPPELVLLGESVEIVYLNQKYKEPGFKATDNVDGNITDRVVVDGKVDTSKVGTYELTYTVKDGYDNEVSVTRKVQVMSKVIYLTFDDGPGGYTERILNTLDKYGAKATFFIGGPDFPELLTRMDQSGHTVAIHTMTHDYEKIYASEEAFFEDMYAMQQHIEKYTGKKPTMLRFPGGSSNMISRFNPGIMTRLTEKLTEMGYTYHDWNVDSMDAGGAKTADEVYQNVVGGIYGRPMAVVLMHDIKLPTMRALERIIKWGLAHDYVFCAMNDSTPVVHHDVNN